MSPATQSVAGERVRQIEAALRAIPQGPARTPFYMRAIEIAVSVVVLTLTSPILVLMAILIRRGSPGPALFWQDRIGRNGRLFKFVKFRTLYADAKQRWPELYAYDYNEQELQVLKYKTEEDPRVTPQGKWMRFTSLDELPNFWNLLKGEVALVGPRPEIPEMLPYYETADLRKFSVRPGITGLAQVSGRARLEFRRVVAYDVEYVDRRSLLLDIQILAKTLQKIVTREGAY